MNITSRLEGGNKLNGTDIIIGRFGFMNRSAAPRIDEYPANWVGML